MCSFFSITATTLALALAAPAATQDWRTSGEDPCACTDSMPFIIGERPPVDTADQVAQQVRNSANPSCRVSRLAIEALRDAAADRRATTALIARLDSPACALRSSAAWSLIKHRSPDIAPALLRMFSDPDRRVRQAAAYAVGYQGDQAAVQPLIGLLTDSSKHVRQAAAGSLGRLGNPIAHASLTRLLSDPEPHVRDAAAAALKQLR
jgi:HEAT repeat protein